MRGRVALPDRVLCRHHPAMPSARRFPPPWTVEAANDACFIVRDANGRR
jgi:hypothetical protein